MKANELRIGNWVTGFDKHGSCGQVLSIWDNQTLTDIKYSRKDIYLIDVFCGGRIDKLKPIPLTTEIFEKCGFEKGTYGFWCKNGVEYNPDEELLHAFGHCEIKYLHQLQNLYFALTGDELQVNL